MGWNDGGFSKIKIATKKKKNCEAPSLKVGDEVDLGGGEHACIKEVVPHIKVVLDYQDGHTSHEEIKWEDEAFKNMKIAIQKKKECEEGCPEECHEMGDMAP